MRYFTVAYFKKKNGRYDEFAEFTDTIDQNTIDVNNVVLDLTKKKVIKASLADGETTDYNVLYNYYKEAYPDDMK